MLMSYNPWGKPGGGAPMVSQKSIIGIKSISDNNNFQIGDNRFKFSSSVYENENETESMDKMDDEVCINLSSFLLKGWSKGKTSYF